MVFLTLFYDEDAIITHQDQVWLQEALDVLIELSDRVGLHTNIYKTKAMVCVPGKFWTRLSTLVYNRTRVDLNMAKDDSCRVECDRCGQSLKEGSLASHLETQHGVYRSRVINQELLLGRPAEVYVARECTTVGLKFFCPIPGCTGWATTKQNL